LSASDVATAIQQQKRHPAFRRRQNRQQRLFARHEQQPDAISSISEFPVKDVAGQVVFVRDIAHVHDGFQNQTNSVSVDGRPGALMTVRKTAAFPRWR